MKLENDGFVLITIFCDGFASWWDEFTVSFLLHNVEMYLLGVFLTFQVLGYCPGSGFCMSEFVTITVWRDFYQ